MSFNKALFIHLFILTSKYCLTRNMIRITDGLLEAKTNIHFNEIQTQYKHAIALHASGEQNVND